MSGHAALKKSLLNTVPAERKQITHMLFNCNSFATVANQLLDSERGRNFLRAAAVSWESFEDGFPNIMISEVHALRNRHAVVLADFLNPGEMFAQLSLIYSLAGYWVQSLTLVLPYFPTGTMERVDHEGQIATAKTLARMLSAIPLSASGPTRLVIYDIHALQERFYFGDNVVPILLSAVPLFLKKLDDAHKNDKVLVAFPDEGAQKRFGNKFNAFDQVVCTKTRTSASGRKVTIKEGDCSGRNVFIVDDLVKTGGTLIECKNALLDAGAANVSAFVTHAVFPQESWKRFLKDPVPFKKFYVTDSCPTVAAVIDHQGPFEVIPLAESVMDAIVDYQL